MPSDAIEAEVVSSVPKVPAAPLLRPGAKRGLKMRGLTDRELRFMREMSAGASSRVEAFRRAFPVDAPRYTEMSLWQASSKMYRRIIAKLTASSGGGDGEEEFYELLGIGLTAQARVAREAMDANMVKVFVVPKTGEVVESKEYIDHQTRLSAAQFASKLTGTVKERDGAVGGQVVVNIVNYARPGDEPWPGGGRQ